MHRRILVSVWTGLFFIENSFPYLIPSLCPQKTHNHHNSSACWNFCWRCDAMGSNGAWAGRYELDWLVHWLVIWLKQIISALCLNFPICNKEVMLVPSFISVLCAIYFTACVGSSFSALWLSVFQEFFHHCGCFYSRWALQASFSEELKSSPVPSWVPTHGLNFFSFLFF